MSYSDQKSRSNKDSSDHKWYPEPSVWPKRFRQARKDQPPYANQYGWLSEAIAHFRYYGIGENFTYYDKRNYQKHGNIDPQPGLTAGTYIQGSDYLGDEKNPTAKSFLVCECITDKEGEKDLNHKGWKILLSIYCKSNDNRFKCSDVFKVSFNRLRQYGDIKKFTIFLRSDLQDPYYGLLHKFLSQSKYFGIKPTKEVIKMKDGTSCAWSYHFSPTTKYNNDNLKEKLHKDNSTQLVDNKAQLRSEMNLTLFYLVASSLIYLARLSSLSDIIQFKIVRNTYYCLLTTPEIREFSEKYYIFFLSGYCRIILENKEGNTNIFETIAEFMSSFEFIIEPLLRGNIEFKHLKTTNKESNLRKFPNAWGAGLFSANTIKKLPDLKKEEPRTCCIM